MSDQKSQITKRTMFLFFPLILIFISIFGKLLYISIYEGPELRKIAETTVITEKIIDADRGNIYSSDGKLLATSMPLYDVFMDPSSPSDKNFDENIHGLSKGLAKLFPVRNANQWEVYIKSKRANKDKYIKLGEEITFSQLQMLKSLPLFNLGKYKGGLISQEKTHRKMPLGKIAERTIGYERNTAQAGIEGAYDNYLKGRQGKRMYQKISKGNWKPLADANAIEPQDGMDVITTIDTKIQDVAHRSLLHYLTKYEADHGCVVVMEVATGEIKAIVNLGRTESGGYYEKRNYAVWEATEPGSTFKLASLLVALDDGVVDTSTIVDTEDGTYQIYNRKVKDSNVKYGNGGYGKINVAEAFRKSSNTGIVKAIYPHYKDHPQDFIDQLYKIGLHQKTGIEIPGESTPHIPKPGDANWSGTSLPWITFGYEISMTPLQMLSFYNAIANDGVMLRPRIVSEIRERGKTIQHFQPEVLNPAICSKQSLQIVQALLKGTVDHGTAQRIKLDNYPMAGKTGTCQMNYWTGERQYQASFAGYFPADKPLYSCIVVVNNPNVNKGFYGSDVAAPVFRDIAMMIYESTPTVEEIELEETSGIAENKNDKAVDAELRNHRLPDLRGLSAPEAISILENHGYKVQIEGNGRVRSQSPAPGTLMNARGTIALKLG